MPPPGFVAETYSSVRVLQPQRAGCDSRDKGWLSLSLELCPVQKDKRSALFMDSFKFVFELGMAIG